MDDKKKKVQKFTNLYMGYGMCYGIAFGLILGRIIHNGNISLGMCTGLSLGLCIGSVVGAAKDKRLAERMMEIVGIEVAVASPDVVVCAKDSGGVEKSYQVTPKKLKQENFRIGDRVAEENNGTLVSLESK